MRAICEARRNGIVPLGAAALIALGAWSAITASDARGETRAREVLASKVTGAKSPFGECTRGPIEGRDSVGFVNAEYEPHAAVNPTNQRNIVGLWMSDRWSDGGGRAIVAASSFDGGKTWKETPLPFNACVEGGLQFWDRATDPVVAFGPDGTAYASSTVFNLDVSGLDAADAIAVATSSDGGRTWSSPVLVEEERTTQFLNDKQWIVADPVRAGTAYVVWNRFVNFPDEGEDEAPIWFSKTEDGGRSWSEPRAIVDGPRVAFDRTPIIAVDENGDLVTFWGARYAGNQGDLGFIKSTDGGDTWSEPQVIMNVVRGPSPRTPNTNEPIRTSGNIPAAAIDPTSGQMYIVWEDARFSDGEFWDVAITTSSDHGETWSEPAQVSTPSGASAFTPSIAINSSGRVGVSYFDMRAWDVGVVATLPTNLWLKTFALSSVGELVNAAETQIGRTFNLFGTPFAGGYGTGDYEGMVTIGERFHPFYIRSNCRPYSAKCAGRGKKFENMTDTYFAWYPR